MRKGRPGEVCSAIVVASLALAGAQCRSTQLPPAEPVRIVTGLHKPPRATDTTAGTEGAAPTASTAPAPTTGMAQEAPEYRPHDQTAVPAGARPPLPAADWGEPQAKYAACPRSLCPAPPSGPAESPVRGCEPDAPHTVETPPTPVQEADPGCYAGNASWSSRGYAASSIAGLRQHQPLAGSLAGLNTPEAAATAGVQQQRRAEYSSVPSAARDSVASTVVPELVVIGLDDDAPGWEERSAAAEDAGPSQGTLRSAPAAGNDEGAELPLQHTQVSAEIGGAVARTVVEQVYANPFSKPIEAVYVFPLPELAAVNDFVMDVGDRRIVGLIRPREEALRIYEDAREQGWTASLLTEERPNIFTQSVANIAPGAEVVIRITYFERLVYEHGRYEWVFPMVVGPRYIAGRPAVAPADTDPSPAAAPTGWSPPTDRVPDADRVTPPVLRPGDRSGHDIGLTVTLDAALVIRELETVTHCVDVEEFGGTKRRVTLSPADAIPNRDFVLRWSVAGDELQAAVLTHRDGEHGYLSLLVQPPHEPADEEVAPREISFVIDVSGSQQGLPLGISKEIVRRTLDELRPDDTFNIFYFASGNGQLWETARPRDPANVQEARRFLDGLCGSGGTEMLEGLRRTLDGGHDPDALQMIVFLTDGYVGEDDAILRFVEQERGDTRFFAFGIGSAVNRYLVDGVGRLGGGTSSFVLPRDPDHAARAVERLLEQIDSPVLVDVEIDWNGLPVVDAVPRDLPDLFAGGTLALAARYAGPARGTAYVDGRVGRRQVRLPVEVDLPERRTDNAALAPLWARWHIADRSREAVGADEERRSAIAQEITDVALEFRLVSPYTAFVAVDDSQLVGDGAPSRVLQPVELPEGVSYEGVFGEPPPGEPR
ncbi:MAG: VWA domain-containing protein [Deltaproteobacteria bacterium]|nr:VWA domain-containing protein [Deltaproteobacteria bacterium]